MAYPTFQARPNLILLSVIALCGVVVLVIFYLIYLNLFSSSKRTISVVSPVKLYNNRNSVLPSMHFPSKTIGAEIPETTTALNPFDVPKSGNKEVFHIKNNIFSYEDAPAVCGLYDADVATIEQLKQAHKQGADWCSGGWTKEGLVAYPIQKSTYDKLQENDPQNRNICGRPGINLLRNEHDLLYGVNCYGIKRRPIGLEKVKEVIMSDADRIKQQKMDQFRKINIMLSPYNNEKWSEY